MEFSDIIRYYNHHARAMALVFDKKYGVMHPSRRLPKSQQAASRKLHAAEEFVSASIEKSDAKRVFDLGCGFSASMMYLSNIFTETIFSGICASETEIELSRNIVREAGKIKSVVVFKGDYEDPTNFRVFPKQQVVYAIDSLRHVRDSAKLLQNLHAVLDPGASLIIIDIFANDQEDLPPHAKHKAAFLSHFAQTNGLHQVMGLREFYLQAKNAGFSATQDEDWGKTIKRAFPQALMQGIFQYTFGLVDRSFGTVWHNRSLLERGIANNYIVYHALEFKRD